MPVPSAAVEPVADEPSLIHHDDHLVAVYKPAGWLVHRSEIDRHETRIVLQWLRDHIGQRVHPLHRLDKPTAGLLLFALDADSARLMERAFAGGEVSKTYLGVVRGIIEAEGHIDHPLEEPGRCLLPGSAAKAAQPAQTDYRRLASIELPFPVRPYPSSRYSLVRLLPRTGRTHQLRRHLKHIFHPLIGDTSYGDGHHNRLFRERFGSHRLLLVACALGFNHPRSGERLALSCRPDAQFLALLARLGWDESGPLPGSD